MSDRCCDVSMGSASCSPFYVVLGNDRRAMPCMCVDGVGLSVLERDRSELAMLIF